MSCFFDDVFCFISNLCFSLSFATHSFVKNIGSNKGKLFKILKKKNSETAFKYDDKRGEIKGDIVIIFHSGDQGVDISA